MSDVKTIYISSKRVFDFEVKDDRIVADLYDGDTDSGGHLRAGSHLGTLYLTVGEWQLFGAALLLGTERMTGHLEVRIDDALAKANEAVALVAKEHQEGSIK